MQVEHRDRDLADELAAAGIARASSGRQELLDQARSIAHRLGLARQATGITMDDVRNEMERHGLDPAALGNAAGAVFRGDGWECIGFEKSERVASRGHMMRRWRLA